MEAMYPSKRDCFCYIFHTVFLALRAQIWTCEAGVWVSHIGKRLSNQPHGVLNRAILYLTFAGGEGYCTLLPHKGV